MSEPQLYHPYMVWEDWLGGMWQAPPDVTEEAKLAAHILSSPDLFYHSARAMLDDWPNAAEHNLTNLQQNRLAWVGQAACCHLAKVGESATRQAWWTLTGIEQRAANEVASQVIAEWERDRVG